MLRRNTLTNSFYLQDINFMEIQEKYQHFPLERNAFFCVLTGAVFIDNFSDFLIASDKRGIHIIFFLFLHENICCGYSLEVPR